MLSDRAGYIFWKTVSSNRSSGPAHAAPVELLSLTVFFIHYPQSRVFCLSTRKVKTISSQDRSVVAERFKDFLQASLNGYEAALTVDEHGRQKENTRLGSEIDHRSIVLSIYLPALGPDSSPFLLCKNLPLRACITRQGLRTTTIAKASNTTCTEHGAKCKTAIVDVGATTLRRPLTGKVRELVLATNKSQPIAVIGSPRTSLWLRHRWDLRSITQDYYYTPWS